MALLLLARFLKLACPFGKKKKQRVVMVVRLNHFTVEIARELNFFFSKKINLVQWRDAIEATRVQVKMSRITKSSA